MNEKRNKKRSLILAGGGIKVAFQAGVLQVWLDEANLAFDHADGASGGVFNLAMYCQGMSGKEIADNWRRVKPVSGIDLNWEEYIKFFYAESLMTLDRFRENVFSRWGLDWDKIRSSDKEATFNVYNFSKHELAVITPDRMTEEFLVAAVSLPMWFPPAVINGDTYIDAVFITDANIEEAIERDADEIWIVWTVSERSEWNNGFIANYFQIIETAANGHFKRILNRIEKSNKAISGGVTGEFGRHIDVKLLKAEVPLHYLINFSSDRLIETVNLGLQTARKWCRDNNIPLAVPPDDYPVEVHSVQTRLQFTEEMKGYITFSETDYDKGFRQGREDKTDIMFHLTIKIDGVNRFITSPVHEAAAEGFIKCTALGGNLPVLKGIFNLFVHNQDPSIKQMLYRLHFNDSQGNPLTLSGFKEIKDDPGFDVWSDTTSLFTRIFKGHVNMDDEQTGEILASGIIHIYFLDFMKQLTTFRTEGPKRSDRVAALTRFGKLFLGKLWDVYANQILSYGPF